MVIDFVYPIPQPLCTFDLSPLYTKLYVTHLFSPIKLHECSSPPAWKAMISAQRGELSVHTTIQLQQPSQDGGTKGVESLEKGSPLL